MVRNRKRRFGKGKTTRNASKRSHGVAYSHLSIPSGVSIFREEPGSRIRLDIIPYEVKDPNHPDRDEEYEIAVPGTLWYKRPYWIHRNIGANNETVVCPSSVNKPCPICEYRAQLLKDGARWDDDNVRALKSSMRNLYLVIPRKSKDYPEQIHIWDISQFCFQSKLDEELLETEEYDSFPDLEEGYRLRIRFTEEQIGTNKFADTSRIDFEEREPLDESILDQAPCLDEVLVVPSYKSLEAMFFGGLSQDEIQDQDDLDDEENQDEDEDESQINGTEEEKPSRQRLRRKNATNEGKCPYGHVFGKDCEEYDDCDTCEIWEDCIEEK